MATPSTMQVPALLNTLSAGRIQTYEAAVLHATGTQNQLQAFDLYAWNSAIASAFMTPIHFYEVALRNAISFAIEQVYTDQWPWRTQFIRSLSPKGYYSPRRDLTTCNQQPTTGKVIPELKFAFWEHMLKRNHLNRIWDPHFRRAFPHSPTNMTVLDCINTLRNNNYEIRKLRNRIAHHEPIFGLTLQQNMVNMTTAIEWICPTTLAWLLTEEKVTALLATKPI